MISTEALRLALGDATGRENALIAEADRIAAELTSARQERQLLEQLLALRNGAPPGSSTPLASAEFAGSLLEDAVVAILEEAGRPLHVNVLMKELDVANVSIPGAGTQANLISRLRRDPRIVRPQRGFYGLAALGEEDLPPRAPRKKRKSKKSR
jgi:hypothetical protein